MGEQRSASGRTEAQLVALIKLATDLGFWNDVNHHNAELKKLKESKNG